MPAWITTDESYIKWFEDYLTLCIPSDFSGWGFAIGSEFQMHSWRLFIFVCLFPALAALVGLVFMPESPRFLLEVRTFIKNSQCSNMHDDAAGCLKMSLAWTIPLSDWWKSVESPSSVVTSYYWVNIATGKAPAGWHTILLHCIVKPTRGVVFVCYSCSKVSLTPTVLPLGLTGSRKTSRSLHLAPCANYKSLRGLCSFFFFFFCYQSARHDEAWMILRQVHDTNWKAKGEPERVFTVITILIYQTHATAEANHITFDN